MPTLQSVLTTLTTLLVPALSVLCVSGPVSGGGRIWERKLFGGRDTGQIVVVGDRLLVGSNGPDGGTALFCCLLADTGEVMWTMEHDRLLPPWLDNPASGIRSRPAVSGNRVVYYSNRGEIVCLDLDGFSDGEDDGIPDKRDGKTADMVWSRDLRQDFGVFKRDDASFGIPSPSPAISGDRVYCATGNGSTHGIGHCYEGGRVFVPAPQSPGCVCLSLADGSLVWKNCDGAASVVYSSSASPLVATIPNTGSGEAPKRAVLFVGGDGRLRALNDDDGTTRDSGHEWVWSWSTPVESGDSVVVCSAFPSYTTELPAIFGFGKDSLVPKWRLVDSRYCGTTVSPVVGGELVFVISTEGTLLAIDPHSGQVQWSDTVDYEAFAFPGLFVSGNRLYVPEGHDIRVYRVGRSKQYLGSVETELGQSIRGGIFVRRGILYAAGMDRVIAIDVSEEAQFTSD